MLKQVSDYMKQKKCVCCTNEQSTTSNEADKKDEPPQGLHLCILNGQVVHSPHPSCIVIPWQAITQS